MIDPQWVPEINSQFRLQWEEAQDCYVLLYPEGMVKLNFSAGAILSLCDGQRSVNDIITELSGRFPDVKTIADDTLVFLQEACDNNWLLHE